MRKLLQLFGGGVIAAVMVLIVIHIYSGNIIPALKEAGKKETNSYVGSMDTAAFKKALSYRPQLTYIGTGPELTDTAYDDTNEKKSTGTIYDVLSDIQITDAVDDYEKTLAEAVKENRIQNIEVTVKTPDREETSDAFYDEEKHTITFIKSGIYLVTVTGKDEYNNRAETEFLVPVETQWEIQKTDNR